MRLLVASNRLPVVIERQGREWGIGHVAGGLVTALAPVMRENKGLWVGWPGCGREAPLDRLLSRYGEEHGYDLKAVALSQQEVEAYYRGFANETIWPLFHDLLGHCQFEWATWHAYCEVNRRFAESIADSVRADSFVWVHDYQLMLVGRHLRRLQIGRPVAFYLHIPFPTSDLFRRLPWRHDIIAGLMEYDLLGFQTARDRRNFVQCVREIIPGIEVVGRHRRTHLKYEGRTVRVGHFPISINFAEFATGAGTIEVAQRATALHEQFHAEHLILGVDRLDYTKGIPNRFLAFERALEKYPALRGNVSLFQLVIPSRIQLAQYQNLKRHLDELVGRINGRFAGFGWSPIHYMYRNLGRTELLGVYRACEIALITPLRDGMNLVAKEYCASSLDNDGVLVLSEFAGAAERLGTKGALMVNPYDLELTADAIHAAYAMPTDERTKRMRSLRAEIRRNDVYRWVDWIIGAFHGASPDVDRGGDHAGLPERESERQAWSPETTLEPLTQI